MLLGIDRCGGSSDTGEACTATVVTENSPASQRIVQNTQPSSEPPCGGLIHTEE